MDPFTDMSDVASSGLLLNLVLAAYETGTNRSSVAPMTSNTTPTPFVASKSDGAATAYKLWDGTTTYEQTPIGGWAKVDLNVAVTMVAYTIKPALNATTYAWKTWTFHGSNDNVNWTLLDTQTNYVFADMSEVTFPVTGGSYRYLRWSPTANGGGAAFAQNLGVLYTTMYPAAQISKSFTASAVPTTCRLGVQASGALTINTDLIGYVSRDGGTTWATATLVLIDTLVDGTKYYEDAAVSVAAQPPGTAMQYKISVVNSNVATLSGVLLQWS